MAYSETNLCNMALARLGAKRITDYAADTSVEAIQCRTHYEQARDSLLRAFAWRFATARATLSEDTSAPAFGFEHQYILPTDFFRLISVYEDYVRPDDVTDDSFAIEGNLILSDDTTMKIKYIRKVTEPSEFDPLFAEVLVLSLALSMVMPLSQDKTLRREIQDELRELLSRVRVIDRQETNTIGSVERGSWAASRQGDTRIDSQMGS